MAYYTFNNNSPVPSLPKRFRKEDGTTVTDLESYSKQGLKELGWEEVEDPPAVLEWDKRLFWRDGKWCVDDISEQEREDKIGDKWLAVRLQRNEMIRLMSDQIEKYNSEVRRGITPTVDIEKIDNYIEKLRQVPQTQTDPFHIVWPDYDDGGKG